MDRPGPRSAVMAFGRTAGPVYVAATNRDLDLTPEIVVSLPGRLDLYNLNGTGGLTSAGSVVTGVAGGSRPVGTIDADGNNTAEALIGGLSGRLGLKDLSEEGAVDLFGATAANPLTNHFVAGTDRSTFNGMVPVQATSGSELARLGIYDPITKTFSQPAVPAGDAASYTGGVISLATSPTSKAANVTGQLDFESSSYGLAFTFEFSNATAGDQLSVTIGGLFDTYQYFVVDGASTGSGTHSATVSVYSSWGGKYPVTFAMASTSGSTNPSLTIRNVEQITIAS